MPPPRPYFFRLFVALAALLLLLPTALPSWARELGAIATQHPLAPQSPERVLREGGNAVDAAVAAALTLSVVEPYNSGLGGGGMVLLWVAKEGKTHAIDFREIAPHQAKPELYGSPEASQEGPY